MLFVSAVAGSFSDRSSTRSCFPSEEHAPRRASVVFGNRKIVLPLAPWQSHRITTRLAEILLREKLGYDVYVRGFEDDFRAYANSAYERIRDGTVDMDFEMWPGSIPMGNESLQKAGTMLGDLGFTATSGWYIPIASLRKVATGPLGDALWHQITTLVGSGAETQLGDYTQFPTPASLCNAVRQHPVGFGSYDCGQSAWTLSSAECCNSVAAAAGSCAPGLASCAILSVSSPFVDVGRNEAALLGSGLRAQIQYGAQDELIRRAEVEGIPLILHSWEPNPSIISEGRFLRLRLTEKQYCESSSDPDDRKTYVVTKHPKACDFPLQKVEKRARDKLETAEGDAAHFGRSFSLSFSQMWELLSSPDDIGSGIASSDRNETSKDADDFERACNFLQSKAECVEGPGCWRQWIQPKRQVPIDGLAEILASSEGSRVSELGFAVLLSLFLATAIYVFGRGDDGYTSGRSWFTLIHLLRSIAKCFAGARTARKIVSSISRRAVPMWDYEESRRKRRNLSRVVQVIQDEHMPEAEARTNELATSVTLGRSRILACAGSPYIALPVLRIDETEETISVDVWTTDGLLGNGARFGRDYGAIRSSIDVSLEHGNMVTLVFEPGRRLHFAYVELRNRGAEVVTGEHDCAEFNVILSLSPKSRGKAAIGPIDSCTVSLIKDWHFPAVVDRNLSSSSPDDSIGSTTNPAALRRAATVTLALASKGKRFIHGVRQIRRSVIMQTSIAGKGLSQNSRLASEMSSEIGERFRIGSEFLRVCFRIRGLRKKVVLHQIASMILAFFDSFLKPLAYTYIIHFGVAMGRWDVTACVALLMLTSTVVTYRIKLNYFHGSMLVMQHLRSMLCRKFLSLTPNDHGAREEMRQEFRVAITATVEEIRSGFWKGIFHHGLPHLYSAIASILYMILYQDGAVAMIIVAALAGGALLLYGRRITGGAAISGVEFRLQQNAEWQLEGMLNSFLRIQEGRRVLTTTKDVYEVFWKYLRRGSCEVFAPR